MTFERTVVLSDKILRQRIRTTRQRIRNDFSYIFCDILALYIFKQMFNASIFSNCGRKIPLFWKLNFKLICIIFVVRLFKKNLFLSISQTLYRTTFLSPFLYFYLFIFLEILRDLFILLFSIIPCIKNIGTIILFEACR